MSASLRELRQQRGLSQEAVSRECRIPLPFLQAIEEGDPSAVPEGPFFDAYRLRYLRYLGLEDEPRSRPRPILGPRASEEPDEAEGTRTRTITRQYDSVPLLRLVVAGFLVTFAGILGLKLVSGLVDRRLPEPRPGEVVLVPEGPAATVEEPAIAAVEAPPAGKAEEKTKAAAAARTLLPPRAPGAPMRVNLRAIEPVQVRIELDGTTVYDGEMKMGETHDFHGAREVAVDAADLTRLQVHLDGQRIDPLGSLSQRRRLVFLREPE